MPMAPRHDPRAHQQTLLASYLAEKARAEDTEVDIRDRSFTASEVEVLQKKDFATLTDKVLEVRDRALDGGLRELRFLRELRQTYRTERFTESPRESVEPKIDELRVGPEQRHEVIGDAIRHLKVPLDVGQSGEEIDLGRGGLLDQASLWD
jgi:hypothetical protein